jgi:hypothetical protein
LKSTCHGKSGITAVGLVMGPSWSDILPAYIIKIAVQLTVGKIDTGV